nr:retrovirus-related Pol polyprotein from transposon TNT 1-94 [Tanacetum cinerariifolium]
MTLSYQDHFPKERSGLETMKHTKPETLESSNKSVLGPVTVLNPKPATSSVPIEVKTNDQESKINELTKLVQILIDEKINLNQKPQEPKYVSSQPWTSKGGVLAESSQSSKSSIGVSCTTCGSSVHSTTDHNDFEHFKICEKFQATKAKDPTMNPMSINHEKYTIVIVDEYSRMVENQNDVKVKQIRTDNGTKFRNTELESFCDEKGISQNFSSPYMVINQSLLKDMIGILVRYSEKGYQTSAIFMYLDDMCLFIITRIILGNLMQKMTIEKYALKVIAPNEQDNPQTENVKGPPDPPNTEETQQNVHYEQINHQSFEETLRINTENSVPITESLAPTLFQSQDTNQASTSSYPVAKDRWSKDKHIKLVNIIGDPGEGMLTTALAIECLFDYFLSEIEPKQVSGALKPPGWIDAMQEELNQFYKNKVWTLVLLPCRKIAICFKWVFKNKQDEHGIVTKNKARLVAQCYSQKEGIDYDETFAPMARMKAIRIFLAFSIYMNFIVFQIDDDKGISICQEQYTRNLLKKHKTSDSFSVKTPMVPPNNLGPDLAVQSKRITSYCCEKNLKYLKDYAGYNMDRKSTTGACQILRGKLVYWSAKKQQSIAISSVDAEYVAAAGCCANILWMQSQLSDYDIHYKMVPIFVTIQVPLLSPTIQECWCMAIAYDPNPPADETQSRPLKEYLIKFSVMNVKKTLTLDFKTFTTSTGFDYNNGSRLEVFIHSIDQFYSAYDSLLSYDWDKEVLLGTQYTQDEKFRSLPGIMSNSNFSKDPSKVTEIELTAYMIAVNKQNDSVSPFPFSGKKNKVKSQTDYEETYSVSSGNVHDPQDLERNKQLIGMGLPSTKLDEGTRKSQLLPEGTKTNPKDLGRNVHPADMGLHFMISDEGTVTTTPFPEGPHGDKDSEEFKPPADMEPLATPFADPLGTNAKYQADRIQSARLKYQSLTKNEGKTSSEVEPDSETLQLTTFVDVQALLLSNDEMVQQSDEDDVLKAGEEMDEDIPPTDEEAQSPPLNQEQPESSHV